MNYIVQKWYNIFMRGGKMSRRKTHDEFVSEVKTLCGDEVEILTEYKTNKDKVLARYKKCGHEDWKVPSKILAGQRCGQCRAKRVSEAKTKTQEYFEQRLKKTNSDLEVLSRYRGLRENIKVKNNKCGHIYEVLANNIAHGSGCPVCHGMKDTSEFIQEINDKYPGEYIVKGRYKNNRTPILVQHKCGYEWEVTPKSLLREIRCPKCIMSKGELFIHNYLTSKNIEFQEQYRFKDCRNKIPLPFDFAVFVNGELKLIEFDGSHHFGKSNNWGKADKTKVKFNDNIKNAYCKDNGIPLLRIPYWWLRTDRITKEIDIFLEI